MEVVRIVERQTNLYSYRATQNEEGAEQLELLIEGTKPINRYAKWHPLISTPFRYNPPHPNARFRPPFGRNVFYGSVIEETALYEHAYHFMQQRLHLNIRTDVGERTLFFVDADDKNSVQVHRESNCFEIIDKKDYSFSHRFIEEHPDATFIIYPSCRDPEHRDNAAVLDIHLLAKILKWETSIGFFYDNKKKQLTWVDYHLSILWEEVS